MLNPVGSVLTVVGPDAGDTHIDGTVAVCRAVGADLTVIVIDMAMPSVVSNYGAADAILRSESYQHGESAVNAQKSAVEKKLEQAGVEGLVLPQYVIGSEVEQVVLEQARFADLTILPAGLAGTSGMFRHAFNAAVFAAGSPLLLLPKDGTVLSTSEHVMIAWDGSAQSARAVRHAVNGLAQAARVTSVTVDAAPRHGGMDAGLIRYLQKHGIKLAIQDEVSGSRSVGQTILEVASDIHADLIVMGAYGHSRVREMIIGGATREVIERTTVPVLMVH